MQLDHKVVIVTTDDERIVHWFETLAEARQAAANLRKASSVKSVTAF